MLSVGGHLAAEACALNIIDAFVHAGKPVLSSDKFFCL